MRIDITDPQDIADFWLSLGMLEAAHRAGKLAEKHKVVGMGLMADLLQAEATRANERVRIRNLVLAIESGVRFDAQSLRVSNKDGLVWLEADPLEGAQPAADAPEAA